MTWNDLQTFTLGIIFPGKRRISHAQRQMQAVFVCKNHKIMNPLKSDDMKIHRKKAEANDNNNNTTQSTMAMSRKHQIRNNAEAIV